MPKAVHNRKVQKAKMPGMDTLSLQRAEAEKEDTSAETNRNEKDVSAGGSKEAQVKEIPATRREAAQKRYKAKCGILDRLSPMQVTELKKELLRDTSLYEEEKKPFLNAIEKKEQQHLKQHVLTLAAGCTGQSYAKIRRVVQEIENAALPGEEKNPILEPLYVQKKKRGEAEVKLLIQKMPEHMDMKQYHDYRKRLGGYPEVDMAPYEKLFSE